MFIRRSAGQETEIVLPITPMLDMSFQLLFFFISTFKLPTGMEGTIDLQLPSQATPLANSPANANPNAVPDDKPPDFKTTIPLQVGKPNYEAGDDAVGDLTTSYKGKNEVLSPPHSYDLSELTDKLKGYLDEAQKTGDTITAIKIQGVSDVKFRAIVRVMDACRKAGLKDISFTQPSDYKPYIQKHHYVEFVQPEQ